jgi:hypothetical protein
VWVLLPLLLAPLLSTGLAPASSQEEQECVIKQANLALLGNGITL